MSSAAVYNAVRSFLTSNWTACPLAWPNENFDKPTPASPWALVEVISLQDTQVGIGSGSPVTNRWNEEGQIWFHIFTPAGTGEADQVTLADDFKTLCRGQVLAGNIYLEDLLMGKGEQGSDDGLWWRMSVCCQFTRRA